MESSSNVTLSTWAVYFNTSDYPQQYCARRFAGESPTQDFIANVDINPVRNWIKNEAAKFKQGWAVCIGRSEGDDPVIVEVWV